MNAVQLELSEKAAGTIRLDGRSLTKLFEMGAGSYLELEAKMLEAAKKNNFVYFFYDKEGALLLGGDMKYQESLIVHELRETLKEIDKCIEATHERAALQDIPVHAMLNVQGELMLAPLLAAKGEMLSAIALLVKS